MATRMLIDATHPEETRVVVVKGTRLEEFDFETSIKRVLKGNIYLAKVTRVEPSLQAAFVDYGGNRHGFLAFNEIHPDYYQIPVADRRALLARQAEEDAKAAAEEEAKAAAEEAAEEAGEAAVEPTAEAEAVETVVTEPWPAAEEPGGGEGAGERALAEATGAGAETLAGAPVGENAGGGEEGAGELPAATEPSADENGNGGGNGERRDVVSVGGDALDEVQRPRRTSMRQYKIQEVIKRRQILLVQVVKEERGTKGAALTTFLSLAGRYCVLMPNTARGGGISRKIVSHADRKRLKSIATDLEVPGGMGVIVRTAGMERSKAEIKRDFEFLLRTWDNIRELTLRSTAPCLVYEEANLIKRAIRDLYNKDIDEVLVEGEEGYRAAKDFMKMLIPSHAKRVQPYRDGIPLFHRYQVESQLDAMYSPNVQLRSGGYIVINPTEALVSIDVNSGKSTREHNIEETAYKTNLEAAEEIARQLRLRDLAGLIVIDFIDMEETRNARNVERRLKDCLKADRARIQVGRISPFGLLEMSRQRLRPSLLEASTQPCPHCDGRGYVRSIESTALHVLRAIEDEGIRDRSDEIVVRVATNVAIYLLNQKREALGEVERRYGMRLSIAADDSLVPPEYRIERIKTREPGQRPLPKAPAPPVTPEHAFAAEVEEEIEEEAEEIAEEAAEAEAAPALPEAAPAGEGGRRRRRRRRRRRGGEEELRRAEPGRGPAIPREEYEEAPAAAEGEAAEEAEAPAPGVTAEGEELARRRRRGRRGGRRRRRREGGPEAPVPFAEPELPPEGEAAYAPTGEIVETAEQLEPLPPMPAIPEFPPAPEPVPPVAPAPAEAAAPPPPAPEAAEPVVKVVGPEGEAAEAAPAPPRRGWWRR
jgi:ribonuclease E